VRKAFIAALTKLAGQDERIMLLTGDLGFMLLEPFYNQFPERFINVGVAEQNMVGIATGLAEAGMIPYIYSITPFAVLRPYEFIRNGPIYHQFKVRIVGAGGGLEYAHDGISHFGIDDIGVLRVQPGISIFTPADYQQAATIFNKTWDIHGPVYYRLGKDETTVIPGLNGQFEIGEAQLISSGQDLLMIALGSIANEAVAAIEKLSSHGIDCSLMVASSINPPPVRALAETLPRFKNVITVEAHYLNGGLGSLVAEFIAEKNIDCRLTRCGIKSMPEGRTGSQRYLYQHFGISSESLVETAIDLLRNGEIGQPRSSVQASRLSPGGNEKG
jgi:transketolase